VVHVVDLPVSSDVAAHVVLPDPLVIASAVAVSAVGLVTFQYMR
jgi:hypothetical protein